jgi:transcriptional regulator with XRE-family HTH domain
MAEDFGHWLRRYRRSRGWTQAQVAERGGLPKSILPYMEAGHRTDRPNWKLGSSSIDTFMRLAKGLELDLGYVLEKAGYDLGHGRNKESS